MSDMSNAKDGIPCLQVVNLILGQHGSDKTSLGPFVDWECKGIGKAKSHF